MVAEYLKRAFAEPAIAKRINPGLSGTTFIDHVIGIVIDEVQTHGHKQYNYLLDGLKAEYPVHFSGCNGSTNGQVKDKNSAYKARNGF